MDFLGDYVVVIVMAICMLIGYILKNLVPTEKIDRFIPLIMGALGVLLNVWISGWAFTPSILLGGLASGLASTGMHECVTQLTGKQTK